MIDFSLVAPESFDLKPATGDDPSRPVLIEAHFSSFDHPLDGDLPVPQHLPGAIQMHPSFLEAGLDTSKYYPNYQTPDDGNLLPHGELVSTLASLGITPRREVWIYGTEPDGIMAAARLIWGLMHAGIQKIRLLDGGIEAWLAFGGPTVPSIPRATDLAVSADTPDRKHLLWPVNSSVLATMQEVKQVSESGARIPARLVDVRRPAEYNGTATRYYPFFSKAGHVPNAVLQGNWVNLVDAKTRKVGPALESVRQRWIEQGIVDESVEQGNTTLIFYCGTGWRSSLSFLVAILLGYRAKNFDDGFYGWSWTGENPVAFSCDTSTPEPDEPVARQG